MTDSAKALFERQLLERIDKAEQETGHLFSELRKMIGELGGWQAAKRLVSPSSPGTFSYGFKLLARQGLLHRSVEQAVIDAEGTGLFDDAEVSRARAQIGMAKSLLS